MNKKLFFGITAVIVLGLGIGIFYLVRYEIKLYNTVILESQRIDILEDFLVKSFPGQTQLYIQARNQKLQANPTK